MSATQAEVFEAFRAIDVPERKALRAAAALASAFAKSEDETGKSFTKRDGAFDKLTGEVGSLNAKLTAEIVSPNAELTSEVAVLNARIVNLDGDVAPLKWMVGSTLAMLVALLFRSFTH